MVLIMYIIKLINDPELKSTITNFILRRLPDWFGMEDAIVEYVENSKDTIYYSAYHNDESIGFINLKFNNKYTAEIYVMGLVETYHNKGVGRALMEQAVKYCSENKYKFLMVKTLGESHPDKYYKRTREFYEKAGFYPLEEIKEIWGKECPCLLMIKNLQ